VASPYSCFPRGAFPTPYVAHRHIPHSSVYIVVGCWDPLKLHRSGIEMDNNHECITICVDRTEESRTFVRGGAMEGIQNNDKR
jgi:hypothetical protein